MLVEEQGLRSFLRFFDRVVLFLHCVASKINARDVCARALSIHPRKIRGSFSTAATWKGKTTTVTFPTYNILQFTEYFLIFHFISSP